MLDCQATSEIDSARFSQMLVFAKIYRNGHLRESGLSWESFWSMLSPSVDNRVCLLLLVREGVCGHSFSVVCGYWHTQAVALPPSENDPASYTGNPFLPFESFESIFLNRAGLFRNAQRTNSLIRTECEDPSRDEKCLSIITFTGVSALGV
jgi:hypothetical protein